MLHLRPAYCPYRLTQFVASTQRALHRYPNLTSQRLASAQCASKRASVVMATTATEFAKSASDFATSNAPSSAAENAAAITAGLTRSFIESNQDANQIDWSALYSGLVTAARNIHDGNDAVQDRLVELVAAIKAQGVLERNGQPCKTDLGRVWCDLPYFGASMREAWNDSPPSMSDEQWARLNEFAARITAKGVDDFSLYAVWALRDALEVARPFSERDTASGDAPPKTTENAPPKTAEEAPVSELLPGAVQWFAHCGPQIWQWTQQDRGYKQAANQPDPAKLGKLAANAGLTATGFNKARWDFWKQRLHEISEAKDDAGGREKTAKVAYQGLELIKSLES